MYYRIIFRHTWYRFALMIPCFAFGILFIIRLCKEPKVDFLDSGFWFILAINIVALICLGYTIRYFKRLHTLRKSYEEPMNEVLASCGKVFLNCHFFYPDHLLSFDAPVRIYYKDIVHVERYHNHNHDGADSFALYLYTKDGKIHALKTFQKHYFNFHWNLDKEGRTNWDEVTDLLKTLAPQAKISFLSHKAYLRREKRQKRRRERKLQRQQKNGSHSRHNHT